MPATSKAQQRFMGLVKSYQDGDVPASKVSKAVKDAAKSMGEKEVDKYASTKHKGLPNKKEQLETLLRENPAAMAAVQQMTAVQLPGKNKPIKATTALKDKTQPSHKKAKSLFSKLYAKFSKKKKEKPKKQSDKDAEFYKKQFGRSGRELEKESVNERDNVGMAYKRTLAKVELKKIKDAILMFQKKIKKQGRVTNTRDEDHLKNLIKVYKQMGGRKIKESINESYGEMMDELEKIYRPSGAPPIAKEALKDLADEYDIGRVLYAARTNKKSFIEVLDMKIDQLQSQYVNKKHINTIKRGKKLREGRYHDWRNDESMTPKQKVGRSMREIRDALNELDKTVKMNLKLKTELNMKSEDYWKNTHKALTKISERLVKMANKVGNLK